MNAAIVTIDNKMLLDWLDFKGGTVHRVWTPDENLHSNTFNVVIEHPDMPEIGPEEKMEYIIPSYEIYTNQHGVKTSVKRVYPFRNTRG